jgi:hypothetical protein
MWEDPWARLLPGPGPGPRKASTELKPIPFIPASVLIAQAEKLSTPTGVEVEREPDHDSKKDEGNSSATIEEGDVSIYHSAVDFEMEPPSSKGTAAMELKTPPPPPIDTTTDPAPPESKATKEEL